jgi:two-component system chemotaxis response regulator CheB
LAKRDIIGIGGSTGASDVLKQILASIAASSQASIFVTTHLPHHGPHFLQEVLQRISVLPVDIARDGEPVRPGRVVVAAPDRHLLVTDDGIVLGSGPRENLTRPSIDPMLRTLALTYGPRVIGVIVSGSLNDGAAGLRAVADCGGLTVVQDPKDARVDEMPRAAIAAVGRCHVTPAEAMGRLLSGLSETDAPASGRCPDHLRLEAEIAAGFALGSEAPQCFADPVALTCPTRSGVLSQAHRARPLRFRCRVGHAFTAEVLFDEQQAAVEEALRVALRVMEDRALLVRTMAADAAAAGRAFVAELYQAREVEYAAYAETLRRAVLIGMRANASIEAEVADPSRKKGLG